ncbi:MAG: helix-turn-helix transcriptional regulator [Alphaproteobacteria bacterium]|nr:helix-turn-helix transcriptional regulator [Alphaproteobacteria bacterium]MBV9371966.1 helix-turn-helix transcriptional regulator [Alphaproteobacteria bacterium]MBV9901949.1 helix-turn-helix transcriptional regulator [Alphaproteobacteria bacterium]
MRKQISFSQRRQVGDGLRDARVAKGLTQRELGERVGLPQSHISKIEQGAVDLQFSSLSELARALDLELKLVPRQALPAVEGLVRTFAQAPTDRSTSAARAILEPLLRLARDIEAGYPAVEEADRFRRILEELSALPFDPESLKALRLAAPSRQKIERLLDEDPRRIGPAIARATAALRALRNARFHGRGEQAQLPAHSLEAEDD